MTTEPGAAAERDATANPHAAPAERAGAAAAQGKARGGAAGRGREESMVPRAEFRSYYDRPIVKPPPWKWMVPAYLFTGGLAAGSSLLAAGADLTGLPALRRAARLSTLASLGASGALLVADLGRPERFHHMLRVAKPTSPMSVGTWVLTAFAPGAGLAAAAELLPPRSRLARLVRRLARPAGLSAAALAPALGSYTAVLLSQTATPAWNAARAELPFVFTGSAAAGSGGLAMLLTPPTQAAPARRLAAFGAAAELLATKRLHRRLGPAAEPYATGPANTLRRWSEGLTLAGLAGTLLAARRSRTAAATSGLALLTASALQRFAVFHAGIASTQDPRYVVTPQRTGLERSQRPAVSRGGPTQAVLESE
jgi:formate-dependent nitrite reductase membrane component NrfD